MFMSSILSLVVTFAPDKLKQITFWTMGSLAGSSYQSALVLFLMLTIYGMDVAAWMRTMLGQWT